MNGTTTTGDVRRMLVTAMLDVSQKRIHPQQAKAIAMLAQQVNASLSVELEAMKNRAALDANGKLIGRLEIASEVSLEEQSVAVGDLGSTGGAL